MEFLENSKIVQFYFEVGDETAESPLNPISRSNCHGQGSFQEFLSIMGNGEIFEDRGLDGWLGND